MDELNTHPFLYNKPLKPQLMDDRNVNWDIELDDVTGQHEIIVASHHNTEKGIARKLYIVVDVSDKGVTEVKFRVYDDGGMHCTTPNVFDAIKEYNKLGKPKTT